MNVYLHTLSSTLEGELTYKVKYYSQVTDLPHDAELGVVFPIDYETSAVYSIKGDIDPDIIPMLKAGRSFSAVLNTNSLDKKI